MKIASILLVLLALAVSSIDAQKLKAEEIIAKHLSSIAPAEKLSSLKSMTAVGEVKLEFVTPKNLPGAGRIAVFSEGNKSFYAMQLNLVDYPFEKFIYDGSKTSVAMVTQGARSTLGNFIQSNNSIVSSGIFGGTLSTNWVLLDAAQRGAKINTEGTKKINGKEAYALSISPKGGNDFSVTMYFDKETFRHVRTEYSRKSSSSMGRTIDESARQSETIYKITEDFSGHEDFNGFMIPRDYKLNYSRSGQNGTYEINYTGKFTEFALNSNFEAGTFTPGGVN